MCIRDSFLPGQGQAGQFNGFVASFLLLFAAAGLGNGSTFRMIPIIFLTERQRLAEPLPDAQAAAAREGNKEAAAVLGFASALGAYGGFFIPKSYGTSIAPVSYTHLWCLPAPNPATSCGC